MREVIQNFIFIQPQNFIIEVYIAMGLAYFVLLALCVIDIQTSKTTLSSKLIWTIFAVLIPVFGLYAYTFDSIFRADLSLLKRFGFGVSKENRQ